MRTHKRCTKCKEEKELDQFRSSHTACKVCDTVDYRQYRLKQLYRITEEEYERLLASQNSRCAICKSSIGGTFKGKIRRFAVDHDHRTGKVRALLCTSCNIVLGRIEADETLAGKMLAYLRLHEGAKECQLEQL